jgi:hypothetical protein
MSMKIFAERLALSDGSKPRTLPNWLVSSPDVISLWEISLARRQLLKD